MAQAGYTPIQLYYSNSTGTSPGALANGEIAINQYDGKIFYRNNSGVVTQYNPNPTTISFGTTGLTPSTATSGAVTVAGTLVVANGGTGVTVSSGANSVMLRDANQNTTINNIAFGTATTTTAGGTTVLTVASPAVQNFTGTSAQNVQLPDATTLILGHIYYINNQSSNNVSIKNNAGTTLYTVSGGGATQLTLITNGTANGTWQQSAFIPNNVNWGTTGLFATSTTASFSSLTLGTALTAPNGGTGQSSYVVGDLLYASTTTALSKLAAGTSTYVLTSNGPGTAPSWQASGGGGGGVTSFQTSLSGLTPSSSTTGAVTLAGTLGATSGGTGFSTYATGDLVYASASNTLSKLTAGTNGYVLTLASGVPTWAASTGGVTSFQTSLSGLTPNASTTGAITLAGTLGATSGGTSFSTYATGDIIYASASNTLSKLTAGSNTQVLTLAGGVPTWASPAAGGVTSVAGTTNQITVAGTGSGPYTGAVTVSLPTVVTTGQYISNAALTTPTKRASFSDSFTTYENSFVSSVLGLATNSVTSFVFQNGYNDSNAQTQLQLVGSSNPQNFNNLGWAMIGVNDQSYGYGQATVGTGGVSSTTLTVTAFSYGALVNGGVFTSGTGISGSKVLTQLTSTGVATTTKVASVGASGGNVITVPNLTNLVKGMFVSASCLPNGAYVYFFQGSDVYFCNYAGTAVNLSTSGVGVTFSFFPRNSTTGTYQLTTAATVANGTVANIDTLTTAGTGALASPSWLGSNAAYFTNGWGKVAIGTFGNQVISLFTNGSSTDAITIGSANQVAFNGSYGTAGYFLQSNGSGSAPTWVTPPAGVTGFTAALNTASPNNTNNVSSLTASGGTTNQFVAIVPKGTGGLMAQIPDSAATGGNVRGANATDWQQGRNNATEVASGSKAVICGGEANTSAGNRSFVGAGYNNNISTAGFASSIMGGYNNEISGILNGYATVAGGNDNRIQGSYGDWATIGGGQGNRSSGTGSTIAGGFFGTTNQISRAFVYGGGAMGASTGNLGGNQFGIYPLGTTTTTATATVLVSDTGAASNTNQVVLRINSAVSFRAVVVGAVTGGGNMKAWTIVGAIKQGASAGTTALVGTPAVNIDAADTGASTWAVTATADTSSGALAITVTGQASTTIKWMATVYTTEIGF